MTKMKFEGKTFYLYVSQKEVSTFFSRCNCVGIVFASVPREKQCLGFLTLFLATLHPEAPHILRGTAKFKDAQSNTYWPYNNFY